MRKTYLVKVDIVASLPDLETIVHPRRLHDRDFTFQGTLSEIKLSVSRHFRVGVDDRSLVATIVERQGSTSVVGGIEK